MRTTKFRDVLWQTARKMGLEPNENFMVTEAIALGQYLNQWVDRTFPSRDLPEWTTIHQFAPDTNHIVPWDAFAVDLAGGTMVKLGTVFEVYLIDPSTTYAPTATDYTEQPEGIHVGFEHGTYVWIKYQEPPPRFTAESWLADQNYVLDDVAYSYTTGEVYRSKATGNQGHDPATSFSVPPPNPQPPIVLDTELIQELIIGNPGATAQPQLVDVIFVLPDPDPIPDPPLVNTLFSVQVFDPNGVSLAIVSTTANGVDTLATIVNQLSNQLISALPTFTVGPGGPAFSIRLGNASNFTVSGLFRGFHGPFRNVPVNQIQPNIVGVSPVPGEPQVIQFGLTAAQVVPGTIYTLTFRDVAGGAHIITYVAVTGDDAGQILIALVTLVANAAMTDPFFIDVICAVDLTSLVATFSTTTAISLSAEMVLPGSPWWELVMFPRTLANMVIRGGYADILKEWGQTDKGAAEEQGAVGEGQIAAGKFEPTSVNTMTEQQTTNSRYKLQ
jgi:hypothetical protein